MPEPLTKRFAKLRFSGLLHVTLVSRYSRQLSVEYGLLQSLRSGHEHERGLRHERHLPLVCHKSRLVKQVYPSVEVRRLVRVQVPHHGHEVIETQVSVVAVEHEIVVLVGVLLLIQENLL